MIYNINLPNFRVRKCRLGGAGPFFFFHCPSVDALSGDKGVSNTEVLGTVPGILELEGVVAEIEALLVDALKSKDDV